LAEVLLGAPVQTVDADVLLNRDEADAACVLKALSKLGFVPVDNAGNRLRVESGRDFLFFSQLRFARPGSPTIDVFFKAPVLAFSELWRRRRIVEINRMKICTFSLDDLLAARRKYMRSKDIARLAYLEELVGMKTDDLTRTQSRTRDT
jgi:hypothetical protein